MGLAYDIFGNGKTAIKLNLSKYWQSAANDGVYIGTNVASTFAQTANRAWIDNGTFIPDCDLDSPFSQDSRATGGDLCGALSNQNFFKLRDEGSFTSTASRINPALLSGWGVRPYDWQFSASVQQELMPRVSAEFGYSRRMWGNFTFTDNQAIGPADFDNYVFNVPTDPRLPASGQQVTYALRNNNTPFGAVDNYITKSSDFGDMSYYWHGLDLTVDARTTNGVTLQGGFTTGSGHRDLCEIWGALPELIGSNPVSACRTDEPWVWAWRGLVSYVVPKVDVQVSAIARSQPNVSANNDPASSGLSQRADYFESSANVRAQLGRGIAGGAPTTTLNLAPLGDVYPDRLNTVDMRFTKIIRIGGTRTNIGVDLYNLFNANTGTSFNQVFGSTGATWLRPNAILNPRYVRFNATIDF